MNCTICGKSTLPGAMLCAPCKAALKRARYVTVQEDIRRPSVIDVRRQARRAKAVERATDSQPTPAAEMLPSVPDPADAVANTRLARRIFIGIFVVAAALAGASYFGQRELSARSQENAKASEDSGVASPAADTAAQTNGAMAAPASVPSLATSPAPNAVSVPGESMAPVPRADDSSVAATPSVHAAKRAASDAARKVLPGDSTSFATVNGDPPDAVPMPEPVRPKPAPAPPPPPAPDHWQQMRDALAQCDRAGLIEGIICGQKARIQYCEGYWGKVSQCPGPTVNPDR